MSEHAEVLNVKKTEGPQARARIKDLPRNVWAVGLTSFFMDISSEMVLNIVPLFLSNVLGVQTSIIGLIDGIAEAIASILKLFSGWLSDKTGGRKWLAVAGYALSALSKPFFYFASSWELIGGVRWADRVGKGIRTAPRDALVADSVTPKTRGLAFGFNRAMDKAGAVLGILIAALAVWLTQKSSIQLTKPTFQMIVLISLVPAFLAVLSLMIGARDVVVKGQRAAPKFSLRGMGKPFNTFLVIVGIFTLGNSADSFLVLRAQDLHVSVIGILVMLAMYNLIITLVATPAGSLSDRIGRRKLIIGGWLVYALIYFGFAFASQGWQVWLLYVTYGLYFGLAFGTTNAMVADLVPENLRGTAYGTYNATVGLLAFPASFIAGILWQGIGSWNGLGPSAPFLFGGMLALIAALLMAFWMPKKGALKGEASTD
ncbi:permease of the major facilitator superfamily [Longilinea arvoryzae]|uniref:Permease of the major facilitator superfamily n=1 Tax=Longilinea arvoryzae TaxID=360412 RepID=A0A0K8MYL9_9CHLR|nr:MFS transporter [Longilinea arvoryzae]GAP16141.1 permease of the major facilitator superfamily [Longilinea arvoryzae]